MLETLAKAIVPCAKRQAALESLGLYRPKDNKTVRIILREMALCLIYVKT